jgi:histidinol-phosphate phosphatase family protein
MDKRPGVLLDRDGVIVADYHYVGHVERVQFIPGAADAIARFNRAGIPVAIVTNQGGVARGFYTERDVHIVHEYIIRELALHGAHIDLFLYSPYHPQSPIPNYRKFSEDHKPNPGMALRAAGTLHLELQNSIVVGDRPTDMEFAYKIGAAGVYLGTEQLPAQIADESMDINHFHSLADAADFIIERLTGVTEENHFPNSWYSHIDPFFVHYTDELAAVLGALNSNPVTLITAANRLHKSLETGSAIYIAGNGGAAAIANHMETDLVKRASGTRHYYTSNIRSLCGNQALLTATANDIGYDAVFSWQLEQYAIQHDVLVVFSVSGNSANIVRAVQCARELGMCSIGITGGDGGKVRGMVDTSVHISHQNYGIVEDVMSIIQHVLAEYLQQKHMTDSAVRSARF